MEDLTKENIQYLDNYVEKSGIEWFDLKVELVDHLANKVSEIRLKNPELSFEEAVNKAKYSFGSKGFRPIIVSRTKQVEKAFYKRVFRYLLSFFTLPKIIISAAFIYFLITVYSLVDNKDWFYMSLIGLLLLYNIRSFFIVFIRSKIDNKKHMALSHMQSIVGFTNFLAVGFNFTYTLTKKHLDGDYYYITFIVLWVVAFLFCVATDVVSKQIYKDQKELYNNFINA